MGLLDDAIREHMELKRLRGADPGEVAREEQDVLGRVPRREDAEGSALADGDVDHGVAVAERARESYSGEEEGDGARDGDRAEEEGAEEEGDGDGVDSTKASPPAARGADFANVGQETAELDMRTVLDEQHEAADRAGQIDSAGLGGSPGEEAEPAGTPDEAGEPVEDVLEETPDFLRDTPEQERLWFEQQPPRDFDFDK